MAYILTQQDIDRFNLADAVAGDVATEQELRLMFPAQMNERDQAARRESLAGMFTPAGVSGVAVPDTTPEAQQEPSYMNEYSALRDLGLDVGQTNDVLAMLGGDETAPVTVDQSDTSQYQPTFSEMSLAERGLDEGAVPGALQSLLDQPSKSPADADGLTKNQRMVLAFAAIKDAGMALQGKEGGAFLGAMKGFREEADMERKREAALAQQRMIQGLFGGQTGQGFDTTTPEGIDAAISALSNMAIVNPSMAAGLAVKIKNLQDTKSNLMAEKASTEQGEFLFPKITDALSYINPQGLMDESGNPIINPAIATRIARGGSEWIQSQEYQEFKGNLNTIKNNYTFENMVKLKKQGVTFGALSENELRQVSELVGQLDPANPQGTFKTLNDIRGFINLDRERRGLPPLAQMTSASQPMTTDDLTPAQKKRLGIKD